MEKKYNVIAIGNAIVDTICRVEEDFLVKYNLTKGGMFLIDEENVKRLEEINHDKISSGGSAANTVATLAMLEVKTALIGKVGKGKSGDIFAKDLEEIGCDFICTKKGKSGTTAKSYVLITPDGERTMCTYLGEASNIQDEINDKLIASSEILYIEGYLWDEHDPIVALRHAISVAKDEEVKVAFSLSDAFCVERHQSSFLEMMPKFDILFANEVEIEVLIGKDFAENNFQKVKDVLGYRNPNLILAITRGEKGSIIFKGNEFFEVPTQKVEKIVDTTGAGDSFAAGFLYGIINEMELPEAAMVGNILGTGVINDIGARLSKEKLTELIS
ncbi:MAG: sugar/nucleoside kinase (ribokinase family) [Lentimonas sp.]|jgi:sugar/nucleoside kinase (ribokinase family)